jgi:glycosyltransferase involved in cell wall biosynthesis
VSASRLHVLLLGPRVIHDDVVGGTKISFERLLEDLRHRDNLTLTVVNTSRALRNCGPCMKVWLNATGFVTMLASLWRHAASVDLVVWNASPRGAVLGGAFVWALCVLRERPLFIRLFGSSLGDELESAPALVRFIAARTFLRADLLLLETKQLVNDFGSCFATAWFPTTRQMPPREQACRDTCGRLLFLSQLRPEKGLPELLEAAPRFPPSVTLSVFGPAMPGFDPRRIDAVPNATYGGFVPPHNVAAILEAHDALVLPTRWGGEGYPGVIIEAFQMGLPVIVTPLPSIRELVTDGEDGLYITMGSIDSLVKAVVRMASDDQLFRRLRTGALATGERFRGDGAAARFEDLCRRVPARRNGACADS